MATSLQHAILSDDDGFTIDRFVNEVPRLYPALNFTYRPVDAPRRARLLDARQGSDEETAVRRLSEVVAEQIVDWDAKDQKGCKVDKTNEGVLALHPVLLNRLFNIIVWASDAGDEPPNSSRSDGKDLWGKPDSKLVEDSQGNS